MPMKAKKAMKAKKVKVKRRKKQRVTAARRNASRDVMNREVNLSQELAGLVGANSLSRPELVSRFWGYCREMGMLNPDDKRQILFNAELRKLLGATTARLTDLIGLLAPFFSAQPAGAPGDSEANDSETEDSQGDESEDDRPLQQLSSQALDKAAMQTTPRQSNDGASLSVKREPGCEVSSMPAGRCKVEAQADGTADPEIAALEVCPRLSLMTDTSVVVGFTVPLAARCNFEAVATPEGVATNQAACEVVRSSCSMRFVGYPGATDALQAEARLEGLQPNLSYRINVQVDSNEADWAPPVRSMEVTLPQRAMPAKWLERDVLLWCCSLQNVPEFTASVKKYGIDGSTLLALGDADLPSIGFTTSLDRRRILAAIARLRGE